MRDDAHDRRVEERKEDFTELCGSLLRGSHSRASKSGRYRNALYKEGTLGIIHKKTNLFILHLIISILSKYFNSSVVNLPHCIYDNNAFLFCCFLANMQFFKAKCQNAEKVAL